MSYLDSLQEYFKASNLDRVIGNCHATLIGTVVQWWVKDENHCALEGTPEIRPDTPEFRTLVGKPDADNKPRARCDALLYEGDTVKGLVEVEGTRFAYVLGKVMEYLRQPDYNSLEFVVIIFYPTTLSPSYMGKMKGLRDSLLKLKGVIANRTLYLLILNKEPHGRFQKLANYFHGRITSGFEFMEINQTNIEEEVQKLCKGGALSTTA